MGGCAIVIAIAVVAVAELSGASAEQHLIPLRLKAASKALLHSRYT